MGIMSVGAGTEACRAGDADCLGAPQVSAWAGGVDRGIGVGGESSCMGEKKGAEPEPRPPLFPEC